MSLVSLTYRLPLGSGRYLEDFTRLFRFHQISTGKPTDFALLSSLLATNKALSSDFFILALSILHHEGGALSEMDVLTLVALAVGGSDIAREGEVAIPMGLLSNFTTGLTAWTSSLNQQVDFPRKVEAKVQPDLSRSSDPLQPEPPQSSPEPLLRPAELDSPPVSALPLASAPTEAPRTSLLEPEVPAPAPNGTDSASPLAAPLASRISGTLDRLELDSLELKQHLEAIERRISQIEPHLDSAAPLLSPAAEPAQWQEPHAISPQVPPSIATTADPAAPVSPRPWLTRAAAGTFSQAMDFPQLPDSPKCRPPLARVDPDAYVAAAQSSPRPNPYIALPLAPVPATAASTTVVSRPGSLPAQFTPAVPAYTSPAVPPYTSPAIPAAFVYTSAVVSPVTVPDVSARRSAPDQIRTSVPAGSAAPSTAARKTASRNSDVQRLHAAVVALGFVLVLVIAAAATFAYHLYTTRAPQPITAAAAPVVASPMVAAHPHPAKAHAKTALLPGVRLPATHEPALTTEVASHFAPDEAEHKTTPANSVQPETNTLHPPTPALNPANSAATTASANTASTSQSDAMRSSTPPPGVPEGAALTPRLPSVSPAAPPVVQHSNSTDSESSSTVLKSLASNAAPASSSAPTPRSARPAGDIPKSSSAAVPLGPVSVPSDVIMHNLVSALYPVYPAEAKAFRIEGSVVVQILISKSGAVKAAKAVQGPLQLQLSAATAARSWRFRPYLVAGEPVEVNTYVRFSYTAH